MKHQVTHRFTGDLAFSLLVGTGKNLGVRRRYPPVLNDARYSGAVAR